MVGRTAAMGTTDCRAGSFGAMSSVATTTRPRAVFIDSPRCKVTWATTAVVYGTCGALERLRSHGEAHKNVTRPSWGLSLKHAACGYSRSWRIGEIDARATLGCNHQPSCDRAGQTLLAARLASNTAGVM